MEDVQVFRFQSCSMGLYHSLQVNTNTFQASFNPSCLTRSPSSPPCRTGGSREFVRVRNATILVCHVLYRDVLVSSWAIGGINSFAFRKVDEESTEQHPLLANRS
jgi:hypothetical protein